MYIVKLMHLQLAVLDSFIVLTKNNAKSWKLIELRRGLLLIIIISVHVFPLVYSYSFVLKLVQHYVRAFDCEDVSSLVGKDWFVC